MGVSRAKKSCTIASHMKDLEALCRRKATPRQTLLNHLFVIRNLVGYLGGVSEAPLPELPHFEDMSLSPLDEPAVPLRPSAVVNTEDGEEGTMKKKNRF